MTQRPPERQHVGAVPGRRAANDTPCRRRGRQGHEGANSSARWARPETPRPSTYVLAEGVAAAILEQLGVAADRIHDAGHRLFGPEEDPVDQTPELSGEAADAVDAAVGIARGNCPEESGSFVGTEHLLAALALDPGSRARRVLNDLDASHADAIKRELSYHLGLIPAGRAGTPAGAAADGLTGPVPHPRGIGRGTRADHPGTMTFPGKRTTGWLLGEEDREPAVAGVVEVQQVLDVDLDSLVRRRRDLVPEQAVDGDGGREVQARGRGRRERR